MERGARITRMSREVAAHLDGSPGATGRVHSAFARTVNIEWPDQRLLALHGPGPLLSPFGAAVDDVSSLRGLRVGMSVTVEPGGLVARSLVMSWSDAERIDCSIVPDRLPAGRPSLRLLDSLGPHAPSLASTSGVTAREHLAAGIRNRDASRLLLGARALLGLGEGLTPSGDDCLVGALAVLHHVDGVWWRARSPAFAPIADAARERTTVIGREFVLHALAGRFSEPVLAVLRADAPDEGERAVSRLLALGATSGADTLSGMRLACRALAA